MYYIYEGKNMKRKSITITSEMQEYIIRKSVNLSRFVQKKLKEEMEKDES